MASPASIKKHPLHPILVAFPIGLWTFALVCDVIRAFGDGAPWGTVALYCVAGGVAGGVLAAVPGLIDYFSIDVFVGPFRLSADSNVPLILSVVGVLGIGFGGWLGGEMVYVKGMAVEAVEKLAKKEIEQPRLRRVS